MQALWREMKALYFWGKAESSGVNFKKRQILNNTQYIY